MTIANKTMYYDKPNFQIENVIQTTTYDTTRYETGLKQATLTGQSTLEMVSEKIEDDCQAY
jgi:hypothetical protein